MLRTGILNPQINSLLSRVRHTNTLVIADRGFPFWPGVETVDLSLTDGVPTVAQVLAAIAAEWSFGKVYMAEEFCEHNTAEAMRTVADLTAPVEISWEAHRDFKLRVPYAVGLIRTGDVTQYANMILESA